MKKTKAVDPRRGKKVPQGERGSFYGHLVVNDLAPVRAYLASDISQTRDFPNLAAFKAWYSPKVHEMVPGPPNTQAEFTDVCLTSLRDAHRPREKAAEVGAAVARAERRRAGAASFGSGSVPVVVDGKRYGTIRGALAKLGLPDGERKALRASLIATGRGTVGKFTFTRAEE